MFHKIINFVDSLNTHVWFGNFVVPKVISRTVSSSSRSSMCLEVKNLMSRYTCTRGMEIIFIITITYYYYVRKPDQQTCSKLSNQSWFNSLSGMETIQLEAQNDTCTYKWYWVSNIDLLWCHFILINTFTAKKCISSVQYLYILADHLSEHKIPVVYATYLSE